MSNTWGLPCTEPECTGIDATATGFCETHLALRYLALRAAQPLAAAEYIAVLKALEGELRFVTEGGAPDAAVVSALAKFRAGASTASPLPDGIAGVVWVESICGYSGARVYDERRVMLERAGFVRFQAPAPSPHELFVLQGTWAAKGVIEGFTLEQIAKWVMQRVRAGVVCVGTQRWGLTID